MEYVKRNLRSVSPLATRFTSSHPTALQVYLTLFASPSVWSYSSAPLGRMYNLLYLLISYIKTEGRPYKPFNFLSHFT